MNLRSWSAGVIGLYWAGNLVLGWSAVIVLRIIANPFRLANPTLASALGLLSFVLLAAAIVPPLAVNMKWKRAPRGGDQA